MLQLDEPKMEVAAVAVGGKVDACAAEVALPYIALLDFLFHGKGKILFEVLTINTFVGLRHMIKLQSFSFDIISVIS